MRLRSHAFSDHTPLPYEHSHAAGDVSPPLEWSNVPDQAAELVLVCEDPDAPGGSFFHWFLAAIPPGTTGLKPGEVPTDGVEGRNDFGSDGYGGPHPPPGHKAHRYFFRLYALSRASGLRRGFTHKDVQKALKDKVIATGTLVGTYKR